ncbi:unnamed protein product [Caenorhabditis angaria]|uniref:C-type lectin domain-containing protein n=1 Tax=Caenorhabditis angaria TaxID=860376 RepID=A0A9P1II19_9PELO|nr:unnamed protein product [Caenorhabditis angaria]
MLLLLLFLVAPTLQSAIRDESFLRFCGKVGSGGMVSGTDLEGLTCTVKWSSLTTTQDNIEYVCKTKAPYPVKEAKLYDTNRPECTYENVYSCRADYTQINGYCYRIASTKLISYENAKELCENDKTKLEISGKVVQSEIVDLFDEDLIRLFELYFEEMSSIWVQPRDDFKDQIEFDGNGPNYAIVYGMAIFYSVGPNSLIKMPENHRAQTMCFYRPDETPNSFGYKSKKLAKYYWPTLKQGIVTVWRTSGAYNYWLENQSKTFAIEKCRKSMAPIADVETIDVFDPTIEKMKILRDSADVKESFIFAYSPTYLCCYHTTYTSNHQTYYHYYSRILHFSKSYGDFVCEPRGNLPAMQSKYYSFSSQSHGDRCQERAGTFLTFSEPISGRDNFELLHRRDAPLLCSIFYKDVKERTHCADGWQRFERGSGRVVCHRYFMEQKNFHSAARDCVEHGGQLSTFTSPEEYNLLIRNNVQVWIGATKRSNCAVVGSGSCSAREIVVWSSDAFADYSDAVKAFTSTHFHSGEPNNAGSNEYCIHIKFNLLNDLGCNLSLFYWCVKDAEY